MKSLSRLAAAAVSCLVNLIAFAALPGDLAAAAPVITRPPLNTAAEVGGTFSLSVLYTSALPATVQWQRDPDGLGAGQPFANLTGATSATYTVSTAQAATHGGAYRVIVTSADGSSNSDHAIVTISPPSGTLITPFVTSVSLPSIRASAFDSAGRIIAAGGAQSFRLLPTGALDPAFASHVYNNTVNAVFAQSGANAGKTLIVGTFTVIDGVVDAPNYVIRLLSDGSIENGFPVIGGTGVQAFAPGFGNTFYLGKVDGYGLERRNENGVYDPTFVAPAEFFNASKSNTKVWAIREQRDGRVLVSHQTADAANNFTGIKLVRLSASAAPDANFIPPILNNGIVTGIDELPDGRIAIVGRFTTINGTARNHVALLNADGTLDTSFDPGVGLNITGADPLYGVREFNGRLLVWGDFTTVNATAANGLIRFNLDGSVDSTFAIGTGAAGGKLATVATALDGTLFVGGGFTTFNGATRTRAALLANNAGIGAIGFARLRASVIDNPGSVTLTLRRQGTDAAPASIHYATADDTATAGADYTASSGTVTWDWDDFTDKTISIPILGDTAIESTESFRVVLSAATGPVTAGSAATVELLDSDTPPSFTTPLNAVQTNLSVGGALVLNVSVSSPTPVTYQWFLNGVLLPGITGPGYVQTPLTLADAGLYTLVVTNAAGSVTSAPVHVIVAPQGGFPVPGQPTTGRPSFPSGTATSLLALPDGGALVGGLFTADATANRPQAYLLRVRADGTTDPSFSLVLNAPVVALARHSDGKIYVGGNFGTVNSATQRYLVRLNADLTLDTAFNAAAAPAFPNFTRGSFQDLAVDSTGRAYASFINTGVSPFNGSVARFSSSGVLDSAYIIGTANGGPVTIALDTTDRLLVGGSFTNIGAVAAVGTAPATSPARRSFARFSTTGTLDAAFLPDFPAVGARDIVVQPGTGRIFVGLDASPGLVEVPADGSINVFGLGENSSVSELALSPDGRPTLARGVTGSTGLLRYIPAATASGTPAADTAFNIGTGANIAGPQTLAYLPDGTLWVAGSFTTFNGVATAGLVRLEAPVGDPGIVNPPVRVDANAAATARLFVGAAGTNLTYLWSRAGVPLADDARISGATTSVLAITGLVAGDDALYTVAVTGGTPATTIVSTPVKLNVLGAPSVVASPAASYAPAFGATLTLAADILAATPATYVWTRDGVVIQNGGRYSGATTGTLVINGANNSDNGAYTLTVTNAQGAAATTPATVAVAQVPTDRDPATTVLGSNSSVYTLLHLPDGRTLVAGNLTGAAGTTAFTRLAVVETDYRVTPTPVGNFDGSPSRLVRQPDGKILVLGEFTTIGGLSGSGRTRLARLNADLTLDTTFLPPVPANATTSAVLDAQGRIYLGGLFTLLGGRSDANYLVRLFPDGRLDPSFSLTLNGTVQDLVVQTDGKILVGGNFNTHGPVNAATPVQGLVRLNANSDGALDTGFTASFAPAGAYGTSILDLDLDSQQRPVVSAFFLGASSPYAVARLLSTGAKDTSFTFTETLSQAPAFILPVAGDQILAGGSFYTASVNNGLLRFNADGSRDTAFFAALGVGFGASNANLRTGAFDSAGRLWLGGDPTTYKSVSINKLLVLQGDTPALAFASQPAGLTRDLAGTATFNATALGNNGFTYQWLKNGAPLADGGRISGATTASLAITGLVATDSAAYTVVASTSPGVSLTSAAAPLVVLAAPEVVAAPASLTVDFGATATFVASVRGAATLSYQWQHLGAPLANGTTGGVTVAGATTSTLTVSGATFAQAGDYRLRVTNTLGAATTAPAVLTVARRPGSLASGLGAPSANGTVHAILRLADGSVLVGGQFSIITVNGVANPRQRLARFLADGTLDPAFTPVINNHVRALAQDSAGRIFIAGDFNGSTTIGGVTANRIRVARLTSALVLDTAFDTSKNGPNATINALAPLGDGSVYVGGVSGFNAVGATTGLNRLALLGASGALDPAFTAPASISNEVVTLLRRPDGKLYVGGSFGNQLLAATGVRDPAFVAQSAFSGFFSHALFGFLLLDDGSVVAAGNGLSPAGYLRRLHADTGASQTDYIALLAAATPSLAHPSTVTALARQDDGKLLSASTTTLRRTDLAGVAAIPSDTEFALFSPGSAISALATDALGRIWVGGTFSTYNGVNQANLAILAGGDFDSRSGVPPTPAQVFATYLETAAIPEGQRTPADDPDGDGIANLLEFALGLDPIGSDPDGLPLAAALPAPGARLTFTYDRAQSTNVIYEVQSTTTLGDPNSWSTLGVDQGTPAPDGITTASVPLEGPPRFLRLRVTLAP